MSFWWRFTVNSYPHLSIRKEWSDPGVDGSTDTILFEFAEKTFVWDTIKCPWEVQDIYIRLDVVVKWMYEVIYYQQELSLTRICLAKAMLTWCQYTELIKMVQDMLAENVLHYFGDDTCEWYWTVVGCEMHVTLLVYRWDDSLSPVTRKGAKWWWKCLILKIQHSGLSPFWKSLYLSHESSEFDEIWYASVNFDQGDGNVTKIPKFPNSRWRTDAILKIIFWL